LWRHKDKSRYGSKTKIDRAFKTIKTIHKIYQEQVNEQDYALAIHGVAPVDPRGKTQNKISYNVRTPAHVTHVRPITENEAYDNMSEGRKRDVDASVVGDAMRGTCEYFCGR